MKKIPTVLERDWNGDRSKVTPQVHAGCEWVLAGEGVATRKIDGTCCLVQDGKLFRRRELRKGEPEPTDFVMADQDDETGKTVGWVPVADEPETRYHREAFSDGLPDGTYELVGPKVQGNPEHYEAHRLVKHSECEVIAECPRDFDGLKSFLHGKDIEGIVFHHADGRMAKIKLRDFGIKRG